jgi:hypothetical protein
MVSKLSEYVVHSFLSILHFPRAQLFQHWIIENSVEPYSEVNLCNIDLGLGWWKRWYTFWESYDKLNSCNTVTVVLNHIGREVSEVNIKFKMGHIAFLLRITSHTYWYMLYIHMYMYISIYLYSTCTCVCQYLPL